MERLRVVSECILCRYFVIDIVSDCSLKPITI